MQRCPTVSASEPRQLSFSNGSLRHVKILQADQPQLLNPGLDGQHAAEMLELEEPELDLGDLRQIGPPFKAVQQIEVSLDDLPDPGDGDKVRPLPPKRRLHRKTRPTFPSAAVAPTLRRMALRLGGESVLEELQVIDQWMLFQNKMLSQLVHELLVDVEHGTSGSEETLQQVKKEADSLEVFPEESSLG